MDEKTNSASAQSEKAATPAGNAGRNVTELPHRRVGSFTLGACLIAAGVFFLMYYFWPTFNWMLVLKIAPAAGLILLGCEVLFFAVHPGRWKYDFVSVLICLCLMGVCFCMTLLPLLWEEIDPARQRTQEKLWDEYRAQVYTAMQSDEPEIALKDVQGSLYLYSGAAVSTLEDLAQSTESSRYLTLHVEMFGPYPDVEAFASDCRKLTDAIQSCGVQPNRVYFDCVPSGELPDALDQGTAPMNEYRLELDGAVQMDWTAELMAGQTKVIEPLEEENAETTEEVQG